MPKKEDFGAAIAKAYTFEGPALDLGATGTGKTKTLQLLTGQLAAAGVPAQLERQVVRGVFGMLRKRL